MAAAFGMATHAGSGSGSVDSLGCENDTQTYVTNLQLCCFNLAKGLCVEKGQFQDSSSSAALNNMACVELAKRLTDVVGMMLNDQSFDYNRVAHQLRTNFSADPEQGLELEHDTVSVENCSGSALVDGWDFGIVVGLDLPTAVSRRSVDRIGERYANVAHALSVDPDFLSGITDLGNHGARFSPHESFWNFGVMLHKENPAGRSQQQTVAHRYVRTHVHREASTDFYSCRGYIKTGRGFVDPDEFVSWFAAHAAKDDMLNEHDKDGKTLHQIVLEAEDANAAAAALKSLLKRTDGHAYARAEAAHAAHEAQIKPLVGLIFPAPCLEDEWELGWKLDMDQYRRVAGTPSRLQLKAVAGVYDAMFSAFLCERPSGEVLLCNVVRSVNARHPQSRLDALVTCAQYASNPRNETGFGGSGDSGDVSDIGDNGGDSPVDVWKGSKLCDLLNASFKVSSPFTTANGQRAYLHSPWGVDVDALADLKAGRSPHHLDTLSRIELRANDPTSSATRGEVGAVPPPTDGSCYATATAATDTTVSTASAASAATTSSSRPTHSSRGSSRTDADSSGSTRGCGGGGGGDCSRGGGDEEESDEIIHERVTRRHCMFALAAGSPESVSFALEDAPLQVSSWLVDINWVVRRRTMLATTSDGKPVTNRYCHNPAEHYGPFNRIRTVASGNTIVLADSLADGKMGSTQVAETSEAVVVSGLQIPKRGEIFPGKALFRQSSIGPDTLDVVLHYRLLILACLQARDFKSLYLSSEASRPLLANGQRSLTSECVNSRLSRSSRCEWEHFVPRASLLHHLRPLFCKPAAGTNAACVNVHTVMCQSLRHTDEYGNVDDEVALWQLTSEYLCLHFGGR
jgi:hypothetical protein